MGTTRNSKATTAAALLKSMRNAPTTPTTPSGEADGRQYLANVYTAADGSDRSGDADDLRAVADVVGLVLGESIKAVQTAFRTATVDPAKVTLRHDGKKVTANYPVMVPVTTASGATRSLCVNVNTSFSVADPIGSALQRFAERKA